MKDDGLGATGGNHRGEGRLSDPKDARSLHLVKANLQLKVSPPTYTLTH